MSTHRDTRNGHWVVRYRDAERRNRSKSFPTRHEAMQFERAVHEIKDQARVKNAIETARKQVFG